MPVYRLSKELVFPNPEWADDDGLLAIGGDLSIDRLLLAYSYGIFPWFNDGDPICWWSPNPRCVLLPGDLNISKSMKKLFRDNFFNVTIDKCFEEVISNCKSISRKGQEGTWITNEMKAAYINLHKQGYAHSIEVWKNNKLVGGLYGVHIGSCFFGESMFSKTSNASKYGFIYIVNKLFEIGFQLIDCQVTNPHLLSLGAKEIDRDNFFQILDQNIYSEIRFPEL